jgi:hypothetical protein
MSRITQPLVRERAVSRPARGVRLALSLLAWPGLLALICVALLPATGLALLQRFPSALHYTALEHEAIQYYTTPPTDSIAMLQSQVARGEVRFQRDPKSGFLASLLESLDIDISSQLLVSSKTSLQLDHISPQTPRAIYFNDDVYVGWVQGSPIIEISSTDPVLGAIFYSFAEEAGGSPTFEREETLCIQCHNPESPSHVMTSVIPDTTGRPIFNAGLYSTTDQSPLPERWGGWYVTGTPSPPGIARNPVSVNRAEGANLTTLAERLDTSPYLSDHSDIVALMVFGHQINVQNRITYLNYETRKALFEEQTIGSPQETARRIMEAGDALVEAMLFVGEAELTAPVEGLSGFSEDFESRGPFDSDGRSLRHLDLNRRLLRYPMSYLVYSEHFDAMPERARDYVYRRLAQILTERDAGETFRHLSREDRTAILEILTETKSEFAASLD